MPYSIEPYKTGYRVYSAKGTPLSKGPLTYAQARQQQKAVYASEFRGAGTQLKGCGCCEACDGSGKHSRGCKNYKKGGSASGSSIGLGNEDYPLSDDDIQQLLGGTSLFTYPDLANVEHIDEIFDKHGRAIMLYLTENKNTGHWVCMMKRGKTVEYFDPYGGYGPDDERQWLSDEKLQELGQAEPKLSELLVDSGYKLTINPYKFQKGERAGSGINTCGRHCVVRLLLSHLPIKKYAAMIKESGVPADQFVTTFTYELLRK